MVEKTQTVKLLRRFGESKNKKHFVSTSAENRAGFVASNSWVARANKNHTAVVFLTFFYGTVSLSLEINHITSQTQLDIISKIRTVSLTLSTSF